MPLRLASPQQPAWRAAHVVAVAALAAAALFAAHHWASSSRTGTLPVAMKDAGLAEAPAHRPWTIVFERPEACIGACARVLDTLAAVARDPASGVPDGAAQVVVKESKDPARDLIVLDAEGRPAGFISHTEDAGRIVSGLATLRAASTTLASR